ncbi:hypothetical protein [Streptomyces eurythermus]
MLCNRTLRTLALAATMAFPACASPSAASPAQGVAVAESPSEDQNPWG